MEINWNNPAARARLAVRIGSAAYNEAAERHHKSTVIETVNGHEIRTVSSRFGSLFSTGNTGRAFYDLTDARNFARSVAA